MEPIRKTHLNAYGPRTTWVGPNPYTEMLKTVPVISTQTVSKAVENYPGITHEELKTLFKLPTVKKITKILTQQQEQGKLYSKRLKHNHPDHQGAWCEGSRLLLSRLQDAVVKEQLKELS